MRAQSLADVAREEEARRKEIQRPSKVYTNKDLGSVPAPAGQTPPPGGSAGAVKDAPKESKESKEKTPAGDEKAAVDGTAKDAPGEAAGKPKDQAYWAARLATLRAQLDRDKIFADALQSRINALTADFSARDDPAQRRIIGIDRQRALDELDRVKKTIAADDKAIADLQEEARRASVPPGWLR